MMDKNIITMTLQLASAISLNNRVVIETTINKINTTELDDDQKIYLLEYVKNLKADIEINLLLIDKLNIIEHKEYLKVMAEFNDMANITETRLNEILDTEFTFESEAVAYNFYGAVAKIILHTNNNNLIQKCLDKLQSV
jgi:hypothetical protein